MSYDNLVDRGFVDFTNVFALDHDETTPNSVGAVVSKVLPYLNREHCGTELTFDQRYRIYAWIDANVPYYSTYTYTKVRGIGARDSWETGKSTDRGGWMAEHVCQVFDRRCMNCHETTVNNQALYGAENATVSSKLWTVRGVTAHVFPGRYPISAKYGPEFRVNLTNPADSLMLQAPLAVQAGGLGYCKMDTGESVFADQQDPDYQRMLAAVELGKRRLYLEPRVDMSPEHIAAVLPTLRDESELASKLPSTAPSVSDGLRVLPGIPEGKVNLALGAKGVTPRNGTLDGTPPRVTVQGPLDGDLDSIWDEADGQGPYRYQVHLTQPTRLSALSIIGWRHHDFAPRGFEIYGDNRLIGTVDRARYSDNRLTVAFPETECSTLELVIQDWYGGSPAIREFELYNF